MQPEFQKQHKISKIYLKQFGYSDENGVEWVSVYKLGSGKTENLRICDFTTETNIFDLPFEEPEIKRHFEILSGKLENSYRSVILSLVSQKQLSPQGKDLTNHFVANLLCRSDRFRDFVKDMLNDKNGRNILLNEITIFSENLNELEKLQSILKRIQKEKELNIVMCYVMNHLVYVFQRFKKVILRHYKNNGWLTSDNPVHIERFGNFRWLIPIEAEIYFPLSKDYCLFMFHEDSKQNENPLRKLKLEKVNIVNFETCDQVNKKMFLKDNAYFGFDYLIFNTKTESTVL
ncbi:MAG: DUF4238 domain-containing protein [Flavobacterium sp.]